LAFPHAVGASFFLSLGHDLASDHNEKASTTAGLFVALMTAVWTIGTLIYAGRCKEVSGGADPPSDRYVAALKTSLIWQLVLLTWCELLLDGGRAAHIALVALAGYWPMVFLIVLRRVQAPTKIDLFTIAHGYAFVLMAVGVFGPVIWSRMGHFGP
jgi:hypothetical protein